MNVAVLGTGIVGRTIASKLNELGKSVCIGTRNPDVTIKRTEKDVFGNPPFSEWKKDHEDIELLPFSSAAKDAEMIFNCTSGTSSIKALEAVGESNLSGKILVDLANPLDFSKGFPDLDPVCSYSLGEQIQDRFPELNVIKTLNTINVKLMAAPHLLPEKSHIFISGNNDDAKSKVLNILNEFGWEEDMVIDLGDISASRGTEMMLPVWLRLMNTFGTPEFNFRIVKNS